MSKNHDQEASFSIHSINLKRIFFSLVLFLGFFCSEFFSLFPSIADDARPHGDSQASDIKEEDKNISDDIEIISSGDKDTNATRYFNQGNSKDDLKDYGGAIEEYSKAIELRPDYISAFYNRAIVRNKLKDYKGAVDDFTKIIELSKQNNQKFDSLIGRAISKGLLNDFEGAIEDYSKSIELMPESPTAYYNRGVVKDKKLDYKGALEDYNKTLELKSDHSGAKRNKEIVLMKLEDQGIFTNAKSNTSNSSTQSISTTNKDISSTKAFVGNESIEESQVFYESGLRNYKKRDYKKAFEDFVKAIDLNPDFAEAYLEKGKTKGELKDNMGALKDFNKAIELKPDFADAYIERALLKALIYDFDGGIRDADKAKDLYESQGKIDKYQAALELVNEIYNIKNNK